MADSKLLVPELNDAETMGAETSRFQELLLQVQTEWTPGSQGIRGIFFFFWWGVVCERVRAQKGDDRSQHALGRQQGLWEL